MSPQRWDDCRVHLGLLDRRGVVVNSGQYPEKLLCLIRGHFWTRLGNEAHIRCCSICRRKEFYENAHVLYHPDKAEGERRG